MRKRVLSLFLVFCMITSLLPMQVFAANTSDPQFEVTQTEVNKQKTSVTNPFTDVSEKDWFYSFVMYALENGLFSGVSATSFAPQGSMTRGMYVAVMANIAEVDLSAYAGKSEFSDVPADHWAAPFVAWAKEQGITSGMGNGLFGVNVLITREQMAVMTVAFFEKYGIPFPAQVKDTQPKDMDSVSAWAKDAVLKLWRCGLFSGDEKGNFNPKKNATRAEGAAFCGNVDKTVEQWFVDTGVKDEVGGEKKDEGQKEEDKKPSTNRPSGGSSNRPSGGSGSGSGSGSGDSGSSTTQYYEVKFELAAGSITTGVTLPETKTYKSGTAISALPVPFLQNGVFLGWYRDAAMTQQVLSTDTVDRNMTLYAKMAAAEAITESHTPKYATVQDAATNYTFKVEAASEDAVRATLTIIDVTGSNAVIDYEISGTAPTFTIKPKAVPGKGESAEKTIGLEAGKTYKVTLAEDAAVTYVGQDASVRELNIITAKKEVQNLTLNDGVKFIPKDDVSNAPKLEGLFSVSMQSSTAAAIGEGPVQNGPAGTSGETNIQKVDQTGTFEYDGTLAVGDIVAIYELPKNSQVSRSAIKPGKTEFEYIAYVEITSVSGDTYTYRTSDSEDVLFTPDVLPVAKTHYKADGDITVAATVFDYSDSTYAQLGLDGDTTVDKGDFIAFYDGEFNGSATIPTYVEITDVEKNGDTYTITYTEADQADVLASMDIYNKEQHEFDMSPEETQQIADSIQEQAIESGFVEEAAAYLTALALETDGFQELASDTDFDLKGYTIVNEDGSPVTEDQLSLMAGGKVSYETDVSVKVNAGKGVLAHLADLENQKNNDGVRVELVLSLNVTIGESEKNQFKIDMQAVFEQEVLLSLTTSGGAVWEWAWIIPYIADYNLNASFEVGTYTGIGVTAVAYTHDDSPDDPEDKPLITWDEIEKEITEQSDAVKKIKNIGDEIQKLMEQKDTFFNQSWSNKDGEEGDEEDEAVSVSSGSLVDLYSDMIENAEESWIDIVRQEIFAQEGQVDPFHILVYGTSADFVVSANVYVTLGMTFTYEVAKQYNFSIMLFSKQATNEVVDLVESQYQFLFYVMGTLGIRAGIEFEVAVGLFSLKLDSVGITAEAGVYAQMWGYFYYSLTWSESGGKDSDCSGAMFIEMGAYLEITFKAQLLNSDKLTWEPTIYENQWPFFTAGKAMNVYGFAPLAETEEEEETMLTFDLEGVKTFVLPTYLFDMQALDLQTGDNYDGNSSAMDGDEANCINMDSDATSEGESYDEENFFIEFSDDRFEYDPETNIVTVKPKETDAQVSTELKIIWDDGPLAFSSEAIERIVTINWTTSRENTRTLLFHPQGGSMPTDDKGKVVTYMIGVVNEGGYCDPIGALPTPTRPGYAFGGWYKDNLYTTPFTDTHFNYDWPHGIDLYAKWTPKNDTPYIVEYYMENLNNEYVRVTDENTLKAIDSNAGNWNGTTGTSVHEDFYAGCNGDQRPYTEPEGFGYVPALSTDQNRVTTINGNGKTTIKVYFIREKYDLSFSYGKIGDTYVNRPDFSYYLKFGAAVATPKLMLAGYDFAGWVDANGNDAQIPATMPAADMTYTATWTPSTNTRYRVEVYALSANGMMEDLVTSAEYTGTTGAAVDYTDYFLDVNQYPYFVLRTDRGVIVDRQDVTKADNEDLLKIKADGTLVIRYYYDRVMHTVSFDDGVEDNSVSNMPEAQSIRHESTLYKDLLTIPTRTGYVFDGWYNNGAKWDIENGKVTENITLTASWKAGEGTSYKVEYYLQDAEGDKYTQHSSDTGTGVTNSTADVSTGDLAKTFDYYVFDEDNTNNVLTGIIAPDGSLVLKRYYNRVTYKITFDEMGGTDVSDQTDIRHGATITAPENKPTKTGYKFTGWSSSEYGNTGNYSFGTMPTMDVTLYAQWKPIVYTVTFDANLGEGTMTDMTVEYDSEPVRSLIKNEFVREGYVFTGWNTKADGSGTAYADKAQVQNWSTTDGDTITLYAQWKIQSFGITFDAQGGECNESERSLEYGQAYGELPVPTKPGYNFVGWFNGNTQVSADTTMGTVAVTLKAQWNIRTDVKYKVEHYKEKLDGTYELTKTDDKTGTYNESVYATINAYTGFQYNAGAAGTQNSGEVPAEDNKLVLKVYYDRNTYTVTFYPNPGDTGTVSGPDLKEVKVKHGATVTAPADVFIRVGYTLSGWGTPTAAWDFAVPVTGNIDLYAKWTANTDTQYQIKYYFQTFTDGQYAEDTSKYIDSTGTTLADIVADTSAVDGFTLNASKSTTSGYIKEDGSTVLKVYYDRNKYNLTFNENGGPAAEDRTDVFYGAEITIPEPSRVGYTFGGWFETSGFTGTAFTGTTMPDRDLDLYAKWNVIGGIEYKVEYYWQNVDDNNYTVETVSKTGNYNETVTAEKSSKTGFVFDEDNENNKLTGTIAADGSLVLKLYYDRQTYSVTFDLNGASGTAPTAQTVRYEGKATAPTETYTREGYTFGGWATTADGTTAYDFGTEVKKDLTLYAIWEKDVVTVNCYAKIYLAELNGTYTYWKDELITTGETGDILAIWMSDVNKWLPEGYTTEWSLQEHTCGYEDIYLDVKYDRQTYILQWHGLRFATIPEGQEYTLSDIGASTDFTKTDFISSRVAYGTPLVAPVPEKNGYKFLGWDEDIPETMPAVAANEYGQQILKFTAQWEAASATQ